MDIKELLGHAKNLQKALAENPKLFEDLEKAKAKVMTIDPEIKGVHKPISSDAGQSIAGVLTRAGEVEGAKKVVANVIMEARRVKTKFGKGEFEGYLKSRAAKVMKEEMDKGCGDQTKFKRCMGHVQANSGYSKDSAAAACVAAGVKPESQKKVEVYMNDLRKMHGSLTDAPEGANVAVKDRSIPAGATVHPVIGKHFVTASGRNVLITHTGSDGLFHGRIIEMEGSRAGHRPESWTPQGLHHNNRTGIVDPNHNLVQEGSGGLRTAGSCSGQGHYTTYIPHNAAPAPAAAPAAPANPVFGKSELENDPLVKSILAKSKPEGCTCSPERKCDKCSKAEIGAGKAAMANKIIKPANVSDVGASTFRVAAPKDKVKVADIPDPKGLTKPKKTT